MIIASVKAYRNKERYLLTAILKDVERPEDVLDERKQVAVLEKKDVKLLLHLLRSSKTRTIETEILTRKLLKVKNVDNDSQQSPKCYRKRNKQR